MNTLQLRNRSLAKRAFTLIEIMVATVIMVVLVGLVIQITSEVLKVWTRSSGKLSANAEARIAMDMITQDLETAIFRNNKMRWLVAEDNLVTGPTRLKPLTTKLLLFTPALDRPKKVPGSGVPGTPIPGDICAVSYELVYQDPISGLADKLDNVFALHRRLIDSKTTFEALMGAGNQETFSSWNSAVVPSSVPPLKYPKTEDPDFYLSGNVADFKVTFYVVEDGDPATANEFTGTNLRLNGESGSATLGAEAVNAPSAMQQPLAYADIRLVVISDEGAEILRNLDLNRSGTGYDDPKTEQDVIVEHGEVFIRRVNFMAHPL